MPPKRKIEPEEPVDPADQLLFFGLGGCNEVGRSCHIINYRGKTVMLDAGMHPAYDGHAALPFYDEYDLSTVDILLISHFHVDHAASLPYVLAKTNFKGRVFMTHPTKAIYKWLIQDSVRVGSISSSSEHKVQLYSEADHLATFSMIEAIDYYTTHTISSIRITPYPAGHVLGAAMFLIEIAGLKILFTGDYSREDDRHLLSAVPPPNVKVDVLITESTYGTASHIPRVERENMLMKTITGIVNRGGRALLPVFALGRAQELLLILDEYWANHPEYHSVPIYYASNLARKCMVVYQTYLSAMNDNIKRLFKERMAEAEAAGDTKKAGPWDFRHIRSLKSIDRFEDVGPCVMLASPGMMQNGVSRSLLEQWAPDPRNGVVITGYSVEGTMAKIILTEPEFISAISSKATSAQTSRGKVPGHSDHFQIPRRCSVNEYSFAAHVDGNENREFVEEVSPAVVILVHGEKAQMARFKSKLLGLNSKRKTPIKVFSPQNCENLRIPFKTDKIAKVVGKLAEMGAPVPVGFGDEIVDETDPRLVSGVLVQNDFKLSLMAPEDLKEYAGLMTTQITCRHRLKLYSAGPQLIRWALEGAFGYIREARRQLAQGGSSDAPKSDGAVETQGQVKQEEEEADEEKDESIAKAVTFEVMNCVQVHLGRGAEGDVEIEWEGNMVNDGVADAVVAVLMTLETSPAAVKISSHQHQHSHGPGQGHSHDHADVDMSAEEAKEEEEEESRVKEEDGDGEDGEDEPEPEPRNPFGSLGPAPRLALLLEFLEAQFGPANVTPLCRPRISLTETPKSIVLEIAKPLLEEAAQARPDAGAGAGADADAGASEEKKEEAQPEELTPAVLSAFYRAQGSYSAEEKGELKRLHDQGVPVPGIEIRLDDHRAWVWLDPVEVESDYNLFASRVKAVVERGIEMGASLGGGF